MRACSFANIALCRLRPVMVFVNMQALCIYISGQSGKNTSTYTVSCLVGIALPEVKMPKEE